MTAKYHPLLFIACVCLLVSCKSFMLGYTSGKAQDAYMIVNGSEDNFGDKRIRYMRGAYKRSPLVNFLDSRGMPNFIYEYKTPQKREGIRLYYNGSDSVYAFEKPKKSCMCLEMKETRQINSFEKNVYQELQKASTFKVKNNY